MTTYNLASQDDLNSALGRITTVESKLLSLDTRVTALDTRVSALELPPTPPPPITTAPLTVTDLTVSSPTTSSLLVTFTEVSGGAGSPANYELRYSTGNLVWGTATPWPVLGGTSVGTRRTVVVTGLLPGTSYQFQLVAFRGTLNVDAVFGATSNVASGMTTVVVTPPPPPVVGRWPHQPTGFRTLTDQPWLAVQSLGWQYIKRAGSKVAVILTDPSAPLSPPTALRIIFTPDMGSDNDPGANFFPLSNVRELYWAYALRISSNWHASPAGACKMTYCMAPNSNLWTALNHPPGQIGPPFHAVARTEWLARYWLPQTPTPIQPGVWNIYEWYTKLASPGASDGVLRWWVNGQLNGDYTNVPSTPASGFGEFQFAPTVQQAPPSEQYMDIDHTIVQVP